MLSNLLYNYISPYNNFISDKKKYYFSGFNIETLSLYILSLQNNILNNHNLSIILPSSEEVYFLLHLLKSYNINNIFSLNNDNSSLNSDFYNGIKAIHSNNNNKIFLAAYTDLIKHIPDKDTIYSESIILKEKNIIDITGIINSLLDNNYEKISNVRQQGEFSIRGNIIDIYSFNNEYPIRIELYDNEIESIRLFSSETQRSINEISEAEIILLNNKIKQKIMILDILKKDKFINLLFNFESIKLQDNLPFLYNFINNNCFFYFAEKYLNQYNNSYNYTFDKKININYNENQLEKKLKGLNLNHIIITYKYEKQKERILHLLKDNEINNYKIFNNINEINNLNFFIGILQINFKNTLLFEKESLLLIPEERLYIDADEIINFEPESKQYQKITDYNELRLNDYVIHWNYGIGIYKGLTTLNIQNTEKDYLHIFYAKNGEIFLPAEDFKYLNKYIPYDENAKVEISDLNSKKWKNKKVKLQKKINDIAYELIDLYSSRLKNNGIKFNADTKEQVKFESMFSYEETPDQLKAIQEVKTDMESSKNMDRLICGDVGYGKTEVAIRAAFKAVTNNKQVAILVPTTILALQHYETFSKRLKYFNFKIDYLCRFKPPAMQKEIIKNIGEGNIDIVIGTHRLLNSDIKFSSLGLLIIDEEQRFGVKDKEKIKLMKNNIDVLTLSATPIPRTLHLSLSGIRDISIINTHPQKRLPIKTIVTKYDDHILKKAISKEIQRGGQIYFLHNDIETIEVILEKIKSLIPNLRIKIVHGRMKSTEIEKNMYEFYNGKFELLLCTTIIENGLDISSVNTIIVNNADRFGLAQLHQLRGRVGRSNVQAYAYLLHKGIYSLSEKAAERLKALQDFSDFGSGYKIAYKDLQIRGAGNLLGNEQSGVVMEIGYELYCQILKESIEELKPDIEKNNIINVEYNISAFIPEDYIENTIDRIEFYKKIFKLKNNADLADLKDEIIDRYGKIPEPVNHLIDIGYIRMLAAYKNICEIKLSKKIVIITFIEINYNRLKKLKNIDIPFNVYGNIPNSISLGPYNSVNLMFKEIKYFIDNL